MPKSSQATVRTDDSQAVRLHASIPPIQSVLGHICSRSVSRVSSSLSLPNRSTVPAESSVHDDRPCYETSLYNTPHHPAPVHNDAETLSNDHKSTTLSYNDHTTTQSDDDDASNTLSYNCRTLYETTR